MTTLLILVVAIAIVAFAVRQLKKLPTATSGASGDAFSKLQSASGKIEALKIATEAKAKEAKDVHEQLDAVHSLLG